MDPSYAPAHSGLADSYRLLGAPGWEVEQPAELLRKAKAGAERALQLDAQSSEAHAVLSMVKLDYEWDLPGSEREVLEALRLNPSSVQAHQYYSSTLTTMGRLEDAVREAHRAMELDPLSATAGASLAIRYWYIGRIDEAIAEFNKTLEANPEFGVAHWGLAQCYRQRGDTARELDELRRAVALSGNSAYMRAHLAYGLATSGDRERALAIQRELEAEARERYASPYHFALIAAGLREQAAMMRALERAFTDRSGWMVVLPVARQTAFVAASANLHDVVQNRSGHFLEPVRRPFWDDYDVALRQGARLAALHVCASNFVGCCGFCADHRAAGNERRTALEHVDDVGVLRMDFHLALGVAPARMDHVVAVVDEHRSFGKGRGDLVGRNVSDS